MPGSLFFVPNDTYLHLKNLLRDLEASLYQLSPTARLVIASDLSLKSVERLTLVQRTIAASAPREASFRWEDPCNIRANLIFLNDIDPAQVPFISSTLAEIVKPLFPFEMTIERVYAGPDRKQPRFFYAGIDEKASEVMSLLRRKIIRDFNHFGLQIPEQTFIPSIFLGRGTANFDSRRALKRVKDLRISSSYIRDISLLQAINSSLPPRTDNYLEPSFQVLTRFTLSAS